ncbi:hypothetical protein F4780DRAFT_750907 [Xylariomycetidae sp. FL0641]|nr:hypothetical protein F4780DRAFT_750907 [Xylariomycetidae sp. FL0641]
MEASACFCRVAPCVRLFPLLFASLTWMELYSGIWIAHTRKLLPTHQSSQVVAFPIWRATIQTDLDSRDVDGALHHAIQYFVNAAGFPPHHLAILEATRLPAPPSQQGNLESRSELVKAVTPDRHLERRDTRTASIRGTLVAATIYPAVRPRARG